MLLLKERKTQQHCEQYLIFCPAISTCSKLYKIFRIKFKENVELLDHVEMYHSKTPDDVKQLVTDDMGNEKGIIRILIGTSAAGIGVNFKGVQYTINYGCPTDMDSFVQQYGRAGKDGGYSVFMLIYTKWDVKLIDSDMKLYIENETSCRREIILSCYKSKP